MNFDANKLFMGITDFFAIFLTGLVAAFAIYYFFPQTVHKLWCSLPQEILSKREGFLLAAYFIGHTVSQITAIMDYKIYPRYFEKRHTKEGYKVSLAALRKDKDLIKPVSNFEFAKSVLRQKLPKIYDEIEHFLAHAKFFRGLALVLFAVLVMALFKLEKVNWLFWLVALFSLAISLLRYFRKMHKARDAAYDALLVLEYLRDDKD